MMQRGSHYLTIEASYSALFGQYADGSTFTRMIMMRNKASITTATKRMTMLPRSLMTTAM